MKTRTRPRPLWRCPKCGKYYVTPNMWHACARHALDEHFARRDPKLRLLFDGFLGLVKRCGPVRVVPGKTGIALQQRIRFAGVYVRKNHVEVGFLLPRRLEHPRIRRIIAYSPRCYGHHLDIRTPADLDGELADWLREAYRVGSQEASLAGRKAAPLQHGDFSWSEYSAAKSPRGTTPTGTARPRPGARAKPARGEEPLWQCPKCGRRFATPNQSHMCSHMTLAEALHGKTPAAVTLFRKLEGVARRCGPVQCVPQKTRIAFQRRNIFLGVRLLRDALDCEILLPRRIEHPRFRKILSASPGSHYHSLRLRSLKEFDRELLRWLREACTSRRKFSGAS